MKINRKISKVVTAALLALSTVSLTENSWATPGRTDANGCHTSRTSGYHCHNSGSGSGSPGSGSGSPGSGSGSSGYGSEGICLTYNDCISRGEQRLNSNAAQALSYFQQALLLKPKDIKAFTQINIIEPYVIEIRGNCPNFQTCMNLGYTAMNNKDYQTALVNFKRALAFNLGNKKAVEAISNVSTNIQQSRN